MKDYSKSLIYTIKTNDGLYVGSTCDLHRRKREHKSCIYNEKKRYYNVKLYKNIRENDGEYSIEIYKLFPCKNKQELEKEEERIRIELNANLNMVRAYRTEDEKKQQDIECKKAWVIKNKDYDKTYYQENKEYYNEKIKCECGCELARGNVRRHRKTKKHLNKMKELDNIN